MSKRQRSQLPALVPLLEEVELAGWSSECHPLNGNFHDWMLLDDGRMLMIAGQAFGSDPTESAWIAQAVWSTIRAHALHTNDAGTLLSLAARSLWSNATVGQSTSVVVAILDGTGGRANLAMAGNCTVLRIRAASCDSLPLQNPPLGLSPNTPYRSHLFDLMLRERLVLVASESPNSKIRLESSITTRFKQIKVESHRRMSAEETLSIVQEQYERQVSNSASIVVARRR